MSLNHACQSGQHSYSDRNHDLYETPNVATEALLIEKLPHCIWEPAAGRSAIVRVLRDHGHAVIASDIKDYGNLHFVRDFLVEPKVPTGCEAIVSNPPYKIATEFVAHALDLAPLVIMLLRLAFLESIRRTSILESGHLARIHVFRERLPMMHRDGWAGPRASSAIPFGWYVWDRDHRGPTMVDRISCRAGRSPASPMGGTKTLGARGD